MARVAGSALLVLSQEALRRVAVLSASPSLGPASGGTAVEIQARLGLGFRVKNKGQSKHASSIEAQRINAAVYAGRNEVLLSGAWELFLHASGAAGTRPSAHDACLH